MAKLRCFQYFPKKVKVYIKEYPIADAKKMLNVRFNMVDIAKNS